MSCGPRKGGGVVGARRWWKGVDERSCAFNGRGGGGGVYREVIRAKKGG